MLPPAEGDELNITGRVDTISLHQLNAELQIQGFAAAPANNGSDLLMVISSSPKLHVVTVDKETSYGKKTRPDTHCTSF